MRSTFTKASRAFLLLAFSAFSLGMNGPQEARELGDLPYEGKLSIAGTLGLIDTTCILRSWRLKGVLACVTPSGGIRVCAWVENAWPTGIFEVIRQPYKTHYAELKGVLEAMRPLSLFGSSSSRTALSGDGTSNQYGESRVYTYVPDFGLSQSEVPLAIPPGTQFNLNYVSEIDGYGWRSPLIDNVTAPETIIAGLKSCSIPDPFLCAGTWGSYFPRVGFINHPSQVMGAFVEALRGGRVASRHIGRIVMQPYSYEPRTGHYIQMIQPVPRLCVSIGSPNVRPIEAGAGSKFGAYAFVHFGVFQSCNGCMPVHLTRERAPL